MKKTALALLSFSLGLAPWVTQASNGYFSHGYGTRNKALAGAGVALPEDAMGIAVNPALMPYVGNRYDVGVGLFMPNRGFTADQPSATPAGVPFIPTGTYESDNDFFLIPHFGYNRMLDAKSSLGLSIGGNGGMNTEYNAAVFGNFAAPGVTTSPTGIDMAQMFMGLSYAREFSPGLTLGLAPVLSVQRIKAQGLEPFQALSIHPDNVTNKGYDYSYGGGVKIGALSQFNDRFSLGLAYQSRLWMSRLKDYNGLLAEEGDFDIPAIVQVGMALKIKPDISFLYDIQHIFFEDVPAIANANGIVLGPNSLGGDTGLGFGWEDQTIHKFGLEWNASKDWDLRLGFSTANDVLSGTQALFNVLAPATVTEHLTFGFTRKIDQDSSISFAFSHAFNKKVSGTNPNTPFQTGYLEMDQNELEISWSQMF
ncbi:MAG: outer membrane protein transport protein [Magnetococcales bacterium]|nr:outer membrane protein transport protein [Magnetococcales bacterium]MBF0150708.1 outer membrane protein transport protein [Magnetococcales bacterium]MBF0346927.1 outer membrane protein transport protein [Magnetococcales bacterium]MBF0631663.1 outer membrane protein transport protein [Magnetococcales bacterium]